MHSVVVIPPADEPLDVEEVKIHSRITTDREDDLLRGYITAAREYCERFQGRSYCTQRRKMGLSILPDGVTLEDGPVQRVLSITVYMADGSEVVLPGESYYLVDDAICKFQRAEWPSLDNVRLRDPVEVVYEAGYGSPAEVPQRGKQAMLMLISHWYEHRESVAVGAVSSEIPQGVEMLLWQDRRVPA